VFQTLGWQPANQGMSALIAICSRTYYWPYSWEKIYELDYLQALAGVLSSVSSLLILVYTYACRCVKSSDKHCNFSVSMLSAQTHRRCQAATALWFDHTTLESSGVRATLSSTALCIRSAIIALAVHDNGLKMPAKQTCVWRTHHIQMTQTGTGRHR